MSIHYPHELTKLGFKYNLPSSIIKEIYNYNKTQYPKHYNVVLHNNDNILILCMNYCTKNKIYYEKSECQHCNQCKYCIHKNHKYCDTCEKCIDDNHTTCKICKTCHYYPHHHCDTCNKCNVNEHYYCYNCDTCVDYQHIKYCTSDNLTTQNDKHRQILYYIHTFKLDNMSALNISILKCTIASKLLLSYIQTYHTYELVNVLYAKLNNYLDNPLLPTKYRILLFKYKVIVEKYIN